MRIFRRLLVPAALLVLGGCDNSDEYSLPAPGEENPSEPYQQIPLSAPELHIVEGSVTHDGFTISWEPDTRAAAYCYLINRREDSLHPPQENTIQEPLLTLSNLKAGTSYRISVCAEPRNTIRYTRSPWAEIEVQTASGTPQYPDWPDEPGRPEVPIEPGEVVDLCVENLCGAWQLYDWSPSELFPSLNTDIYICFTMEGTFELYQKNVNVIGVVLYRGNYMLDEVTRTLSGVYEDGLAWGNSYWIDTLFEHLLRWQAGDEVSEYLRIPEVPQQIRDLAQPATDTRSGSSGGIL